MNTSEKILYIVAGTGIGAALGILFAPHKGEETRNALTSQAHRGVDLIAEKLEQGRKFVREKGGASRTVGDIVDSGKQTLRETVEGVRNRFKESIEAGKQEYQAQRQQPDIF